jgi:hypothetical protein
MKHMAKNGHRSGSTGIDCEWGFCIKRCYSVSWSQTGQGFLWFRFSEALVEVVGFETINGVRGSFTGGWASHW